MKRQNILHAAARNFAAHGYGAASLRDIAKEAGCSLTLLAHHFGDKARLLKAVVKAQSALTAGRLDVLQACLASSSTFDLDGFISAWARLEFDLHDRPEGRLYLALMLRLQADRDVGDEVRATLGLLDSIVLQGLERAWPDLAPDTLAAARRMAGDALYAAIIDRRDDPLADRSAHTSTTRRRTVAFLLKGLEAYCESPRHFPPMEDPHTQSRAHGLRTPAGSAAAGL